MDSDDDVLEKNPISGMETDSDEEDAVVIVSRKKKHTAILDDDDDDDEGPSKSDFASDSDMGRQPASTGNDSNKGSDVEGQESVPDQSCDGEEIRDKLNSSKITSLPNDLFDAEIDSDDADDDQKNQNGSDSSDSGVQSSDDENEPSEPFPSISEDEMRQDGDEGNEMSSSLKKRLKKGAGKKSSASKSSNSRRKQITDLTEIHSETQRIVRESAVKLPYHKPEKEKLSLSVFLARTKQKQENLQSLKQPCLAWKQIPEKQSPQIIQNTKSSKCVSVEEKQNSKLAHSPRDVTPCKDVNDEDTTGTNKKDNVGSEAANEDWDNLPDLVMEKEMTKAVYEVVTAEEISAKNNDGSENSEHKDGGTEQESGYVSVPTSEEENSGEYSKTCKEDNTVLVSQTKNDQGEPQDTETETVLTPKLAGMSVQKFMPKLSGGPDSFIDLDDEDSGSAKGTPQSAAGLKKLMERVVKHSAKARRKSVDMEISVVSKESSVSNDREELSLQKVIYHVHEDEEENEVAKKPGSRLLHLKEKLKEQMKAKRAEARQKRQELHDYDNEEGFDDDGDKVLDDDAELTDQTDTDEDEEDIIEDEEDLLGGHEDMEEEEEKNPFVDNEAEDEDEDDVEEEEMETDEESSPEEVFGKKNQVETSSTTDVRKDFLKAALQKQKTLELFDEDAFNDHPRLSQKVNESGLEISSRPFQQLSGTSNKAPCTENDNEDEQIDQDDILLLDTQPVKEPVTKDPDTSLLSADSSFEMMGSLIPAGQRSSKKSKGRELLTPDLFNACSKSSATTSISAAQAPSHASDLTEAVEDSEFLLVQESPEKLGNQKFSSRTGLKFDFQIEETQSLMLDEEGLIKVRADKKSPRQLMLDQSTLGSSSQAAEDELLALCSGKFTADSQQAIEHSQPNKSLFYVSETESTFPCTQTGTQANMSELLGLCSGQFTGKYQQHSQGALPSQIHSTTGKVDTEEAQIMKSLQSGTAPFNIVSENAEWNSSSKRPSHKNKKRKRAVIADDDSNDSFEVVSCGEDEELQAGHDPEDRDEDDEEEDIIGSDDEELQQARQFRGFLKGHKHGKIRKEFVDAEAELSGSEYDSDENYDIADKDDVLELEAGDLDDVGTEEDLRNQVGKVHLKTLIDEDKKELRLFQEMYLQDGDLHSDGAGRQRKFRWRNIDEDTQQDMFKSDDEGEDEDNGEESSWRLKRHEREKFLQEQSNQEIDDTDSNSQFIRLGKVAFRPKRESSSSVVFSLDDSSQSMQSQGPKVLPKTDGKESFAKPKLPSRGSFLRRGKDSLAKLAEMTKPVSGVGGARNSGKFVFSAVSPDTKENKEQKRPQVKRSISTNQTSNKRLKLERSNSLPQNSIFNLM